MTNNDTDKG